ncbi:MAG: heavy-metal-associated domain-containing protein [Pseudomonadota bacterium]
MHRLLAPLVLAAGFGALAVTGGTLPALGQENAAQTQAHEQRLVFSVDNMTCATCPIAVRTAMERVEGVASVKVDYEAKTATVVFDPQRTTAAEIAKASADAGYPARAAGG